MTNTNTTTNAISENKSDVIVVAKSYSIINKAAALILKLDESSVSAINALFVNDNYIPNISTTTSELAVKAYNSVVSLNALVDDDAQNSDIALAVTDAKEAISKFSSAVQADWVKELTKISKVGAFDAYIRNDGRCAAFQLKKPNKDETHYGITSTFKRLSFKTFNANIKGVTYLAFDKYFQTLIDNLNRFHTSDKDNGINVIAPKVVSETAIKSIAAAKAESKAIFAGQVSKTKLMEQLNVVVSAMIPEGHDEIKLIKGHLNYILAGFTTAKNGIVSNAKDEALMNLIVDCLANRTGNLEIAFKSNSEQNKAK